MAFGQDTFSTGTAGTDLTARTPEVSAWSRHPAAGSFFRVDGAGRAYQSAIALNVYTMTGAPASADYSAEVDLHVLTLASGAYAGPMVRFHASDPTGYFAEYNVTGGFWRINRVVGGSITPLSPTYAQTLSAGNTYNCRLEVTGSALKLYVDDVERISTTDSNISAANRAGLIGASNTQVAGFDFDNFEAADPSAGGGAVTGSGSVADAGETLAGAGTVTVSGTGSVADGAELVSGSGAVIVSGSGSVTDGGETITGSSSPTVEGSGALTDAGETLSGAGRLYVTASGALVDGGEMVSGAGLLYVSAAGSLVEAGETLSGAGRVIIQGSGSLTDGGETIEGGTPAVPSTRGRIELSEAPRWRVQATDAARWRVELTEELLY